MKTISKKTVSQARIKLLPIPLAAATAILLLGNSAMAQTNPCPWGTQTEPNVIYLPANDCPADPNALLAVPWNTAATGTTVKIRSGRYTAMSFIQGASGITITAVDPLNKPKIESAVVVENSHDVTISNLDVKVKDWNSTTAPKKYVAVSIRENSYNITLSDSVVHDSFGGVGIGGTLTDNNGVNYISRVGGGIKLLNNSIYKNATNGIGVSRADRAATQANPSIISGNKINNNGHHGIEHGGSYYVIEKNSLAGNGWGIPGTSGIHLWWNRNEDPFTASEPDADGDHCDYNTVQYNFVTGQIDSEVKVVPGEPALRVPTDGNGVQLDLSCDSNKVGFNVVWANDGAGINLYNASRNQVYSNTSRGNYLNACLPNDTRPSNPLGPLVVGPFCRGEGAQRGEITLGGTTAFPGNPKSPDNVIYDNLLNSQQPGVPGIYVAYEVFTGSSPTGNGIGPNMYFNEAGGPNMYWGAGGLLFADAANINRYTATVGNNVQQPVYTNTSDVLNDGLMLATRPAKLGVAHTDPATGTVVVYKDMRSKLPGAKVSYFGAYYK